jgi:hypothetical protein
VLDAVARVLVESVATRVHEVPVFIVTKLNVAPPATAVAVVVPVSAHVDVSVTTSVAPIPVTGIPLLSSIETMKEGRTVPAVAVADGSVVKPSLVGVDVATVIKALVTAGNPLSGESVSVAVRAQLVPVAMLTLLNVATPPAAGTLATVPATLHPADVEMVIVSTEPAPVVTTLPWVSSTETLNAGVKATPMVAFAGGAVVKAILLAPAALTATGGVLVPDVRPLVVESVAVKVYVPAVSITREEKVATPLTAATTLPVIDGLPLATRVMTSDEPAPVVSTALDASSTETATVDRPALEPAVAVEDGSPVKTSLFGAPAADAGEAATNARPANMRADVAPMATNDFIRVLKERWPTLRFAEFIIGFPPLHFPSGLNA